MFGNEAQFEKYYGFYIAAFTIENYLPNDHPFRKANSYFSYTVPGKQIDVHAMKGNKLTTLFVFSSDQKLPNGHHDIDKQKQLLRDAFKDVGWECQSLLEKLDTAPDFYFFF